MSARCLQPEEARKLLAGRLTPEQETRFSLHLASCASCRETVEAMAGNPEPFREIWRSSFQRTPEPSPALRHAVRGLIAAGPGNDSAPILQVPEVIALLAPADTSGVLGKFGGFDVLEIIDTGGMGVVLKARDSRLNRIVALKLLSPVLAVSQSARQRFLREARSVAAIHHEHVVPIHSADEAQGIPYLVMEFVPGESLAKRLRRDGPLPAAEVVRIGRQIAAGLAAAHSQGIIHRDIKPANILLEDGTGRAKLTDFGLARALDDAGLTRSGFVAGTPQYLSPEQAAGEPVDHRADLFSLGSVLYEMCAGRPPFHADSTLGILRKVADHHPPPVEEINPQIPRWLSRIVSRLLAKRPNERFDSTQNLIAAIDRAEAEPKQTDRGWNRRLFVTTAAGGALALVVLIGIAQRTWRSPTLARSSSAPDSSLPPATSVESRPSASSTAPFVIQDKSGAFVRAFPDINQAIQAAEPGALIECRFTGDWPSDAIDLGEKPLIIRAVANTKPAFVIRRRPAPLLRTRAPLVLEGLTFKVPVLESHPSLSSYHSLFNEPVVESSNAPLWMANCRIEMVGPLGGPLGGGCCVGLLDNSFAAFENCEFYAPINGGIGHLHTAQALRTAPVPDRIIVRNCVHTGFFFVHPKDPRGFEMRIELTRNSTAIGSAAVGFTGLPGDTPVTVAATQNVFDVDYVVGTQPPARLEPAERLLRWLDATNLINVKEGFARTRPALAVSEQWQSFADSGRGGWLPVKLDLSRRMMDLRTDMNQFRPERFLLSAAEKEQLEQIVPGLSQTLGVQLEVCGPGEPYDRWKRSRAYAEWQKEVHRIFPKRE